MSRIDKANPVPATVGGAVKMMLGGLLLLGLLVVETVE